MLLITYEFYLAIGLSTAIGLFYARCQQDTRPPIFPKTWTIVAFCFGALFAAYGGARYLNDVVQYFSGDIDIFFSRDRQNGIVFYGGFLGILLLTFATAAILKLRTKLLLDALVIPILVAHAIGRVGCFVRGCCYGEVCDLPWAITHWTHHIPTPRHPVQIYEALALALLSGYFWKLRLHPGQAFARYLWSYAGVRFSMEFLRDDPIRGIFGELSTSQWIALLLFFAGASIDRSIQHHDRAIQDRNSTQTP